MPRRKVIVKRQFLSDPKFNSALVAKFVNCIMRRGKKSVAEQIVYEALSIIEEKIGQDSLSIFEKAIENAKPMIEVKSRRVGGVTYQVPVEIRPDRRLALAFRWMISCSKDRSEKTMAERLAAELMAASKNEGLVIRRKEDVHRMAEANKAFAHYRW